MHEVPPVPIAIDVIKKEKICSKIFSNESWPKGNTRRVAFMTTVLRRSGWSKRATKQFVIKTANDWNVGAFEHVIDSWMDLNPPNIETIYCIGSDYPAMTMGDLDDYLPPDLNIIMLWMQFSECRKKGLQSPWKQSSKC